MNLKSTLGYDKPLFILAFDHRASFLKMFGLKEPLTPQQSQQMAEAKWLVYEGFKQAAAAGTPPREDAGILVDEQFGEAIHRDAGSAGYLNILTVEKSGQDEFDFEYGDKFAEHIEMLRPHFTKVLIRYNPGGDKELNRRQGARLKTLSDWCHKNGYKFLIEPLIPATPEQLKEVGGDEARYDREVRYKLMAQMVKELQDAGVEPDIWKIEGLEKTEQYEAVIKQARASGRDGVSAVVLGRGADNAQVEKWLRAGAEVAGVVGFAIGRTIFKDALSKFGKKEISKDEAVKQIAENYKHFYEVFKKAK